jgi:glycosyltransferase involved in cell wall biosynthesis
MYHGSIVPERVPFSILDALASLPGDVSFRIVGYETIGARGYLNDLRAYAERLRVSHRIELVDAVPRGKLLKLCQSCDVGLAFMPRNTANLNFHAMTGASNKPFDYLSCGLAALVSDLPDWREMFVRPSFGLACDPSDPASIADAIQRYYDAPAEMRAMGERGRQRVIDEWNYERQFRGVREILDTAAQEPAVDENARVQVKPQTHVNSGS